MASTKLIPPSLFQMNNTFLYVYQEGPVGARGKRRYCVCNQLTTHPFTETPLAHVLPAFSTIAPASIGHTLLPKSDPQNDRRSFFSGISRFHMSRPGNLARARFLSPVFYPQIPLKTQKKLKP